MKDSRYDLIKKFVQVVLPAFASLYFGLAQIWNLPAAEQVVGTIALITTFLGVVLGVSNKKYLESDRPYDGTVVPIADNEGFLKYSLELNDDVESVVAKDKLVFKVGEVKAA